MKNEEEWIKSSRLGVKYLIMYPLYPANSFTFHYFLIIIHHLSCSSSFSIFHYSLLINQLLSPRF